VTDESNVLRFRTEEEQDVERRREGMLARIDVLREKIAKADDPTSLSLVATFDEGTFMSSVGDWREMVANLEIVKQEIIIGCLSTATEVGRDDEE